MISVNLLLTGSLTDTDLKKDTESFSLPHLVSTYLSGNTFYHNLGGTLVHDYQRKTRQDLSKVLNIIKEKKMQRLFYRLLLQEIAEIHSSSNDNSLVYERSYNCR